MQGSFYERILFIILNDKHAFNIHCIHESIDRLAIVGKSESKAICIYVKTSLRGKEICVIM